jgi:hypothetical protein
MQPYALSLDQGGVMEWLFALALPAIFSSRMQHKIPGLFRAIGVIFLFGLLMA